MPRVRRMDPAEAWQITGGTMRDWKSGLREGVTPATLLTGAARSLPPCTAHQILRAAATAKAGTPQEAGRAGVCRDPDEEFMAAANTSCFGAWKANPQDPRTFYERWLRDARSTRAGGPSPDATFPGPMQARQPLLCPAGRGKPTPANPSPPVGTDWTARQAHSPRIRRLAQEEEDEARGFPAQPSCHVEPRSAGRATTYWRGPPHGGKGRPPGQPHLRESGKRDPYVVRRGMEAVVLLHEGPGGEPLSIRTRKGGQEAR